MTSNSYLGINFGHDAGITYLSDHNIYTVLSERINHIKHSSEISREILNDLIEKNNLDTATINSIGLTSTQGKGIAYNDSSFLIPVGAFPENGTLLNFGSLRSLTGSRNHFLKAREDWRFFPYPSRDQLLRSNTNSDLDTLRATDIDLGLLVTKINAKGVFEGKNIFFIDHHLSHLFSALPKIENEKKTLVVSLDGANWSNDKSWPISFAGLHGVLESGRLTFVRPCLFYGGAFYTLVAKSIGLSEGKLMGLAAYATPLITEEMIKTNIRSIEHKELSTFINHIYLPQMSNKSNYVLRDELPFLTAFSDRHLPEKSQIGVAAATQRIFEYYYVNHINQLILQYQPHNVVLVGGCALNCPGNSQIIESNRDVNILIDNSCNDEGLSLGAAMAVKYLFEKKLVPSSIFNDSPYLGGKIENVDSVLLNAEHIEGIAVHRNLGHENSISRILLELKKNKVGIVMRGKYEIGPRALCHRSLIGRADVAANHLTLNKIKNREPWRPLAPVVSRKYFDTWFSGPKNHFMLATQILKRPNEIPAACHIDLSTRCQLLRDDDIYMNSLLDRLHDNHIPPVLINTSLNGKDEPIINDAVRSFELFLAHQEIGFLILHDNILIKS